MTMDEQNTLAALQVKFSEFCKANDEWNQATEQMVQVTHNRLEQAEEEILKLRACVQELMRHTNHPRLDILDEEVGKWDS